MLLRSLLLGDLWVETVEPVAFEVRVEAVLVYQVGNRWSKLSSLTTEKFVHEAFVFIDGAGKDEASLRLQQNPSCLCVLLPDFPCNKWWIYHYHREFSVKFLWQVLRSIEIVENVTGILVKRLVVLQDRERVLDGQSQGKFKLFLSRESLICFTYVEAFGVCFDGPVFEAEVDTGR